LKLGEIYPELNVNSEPALVIALVRLFEIELAAAAGGTADSTTQNIPATSAFACLKQLENAVAMSAMAQVWQSHNQTDDFNWAANEANAAHAEFERQKTALNGWFVAEIQTNYWLRQLLLQRDYHDFYLWSNKFKK